MSGLVSESCVVKMTKISATHDPNTKHNSGLRHQKNDERINMHARLNIH